LSDKKFNLLTDPYLNQATEENFDYIVEILKKAFPDHQVITDETNQVFLTISQ